MKMYFGRTNAANRTISEREMKRNALLSDLEKTKRLWKLPTPVSTMSQNPI